MIMKNHQVIACHFVIFVILWSFFLYIIFSVSIRTSDMFNEIVTYSNYRFTISHSYPHGIPIFVATKILEIA